MDFLNILNGILPFIQIGVAVLLIGSIILQQAGAGLSETFGGVGMEGTYHTRRGIEKLLFQSSIVFGILFALSALAAVLTY
jgi:preprotein translocase subunit SecG